MQGTAEPSRQIIPYDPLKRDHVRRLPVRVRVKHVPLKGISREILASHVFANILPVMSGPIIRLANSPLPAPGSVNVAA